MAQLQHTFGRDLPLATLFQKATIEQLAHELRQTGEDHKRSALVRIQAGGTRIPLFLFHPVGGEVLCYLDLVRQLPADQPVYAIQSVMYEQQRSAEGLEQLAAHYLEEIRSIFPHGPYALAAWSLGGAIAFEVAQQLRIHGEEIASLVLIDTLAPPYYPYKDETTLVLNFANDLMMMGNLKLVPPSLREQPVSATAYLELLLEQALEAGLLPPGAGITSIQRLWHTYRHNIETVGQYQPQHYPHKIILLCAQETAEKNLLDPTLGWGRAAEQRVVVRTLPGNHYTIVKHPHVVQLAQVLQECLYPQTVSSAKASPTHSEREQ